VLANDRDASLRSVRLYGIDEGLLAGMYGTPGSFDDILFQVSHHPHAGFARRSTYMAFRGPSVLNRLARSSGGNLYDLQMDSPLSYGLCAEGLPVYTTV